MKTQTFVETQKYTLNQDPQTFKETRYPKQSLHSKANGIKEI